MLNSNINTPIYIKRRKSGDYFSLNHTSRHFRFQRIGIVGILIKSNLSFPFIFSLYCEIIKVRTYINITEGEGYPPMYSLSLFQDKF